jgi:hypothetical protein
VIPSCPGLRPLGWEVPDYIVRNWVEVVPGLLPGHRSKGMRLKATTGERFRQYFFLNPLIAYCLYIYSLYIKSPELPITRGSPGRTV